MLLRGMMCGMTQHDALQARFVVGSGGDADLKVKGSDGEQTGPRI
jgi:hypothetical protein